MPPRGSQTADGTSPALVQGLWDDPARFDAIVVSGRYLRFCALLESASDNDEIAARRLPQVLERRVHCA